MNNLTNFMKINAIDNDFSLTDDKCTDDPYYGKTDSSNEKYVIHGQAKKSTNSFYYLGARRVTNAQTFKSGMK